MGDQRRNVSKIKFIIILLQVYCVISYPNNILQISLLEFFLARSLAFTFIFCILSGEENKSLKISLALSCFLIQIATPFSSKKLAFSSSWPGIGLITIIGKPRC